MAVERRVEPKWYPILFKAEMVRAVLAGCKTQTRRIVKAKGATAWQLENAVPHNGDEILFDFGSTRPYLRLAYDEASGRGGGREPSPWGRGDMLWVRETWIPRYFSDGRPAYRADWSLLASEVVPEPRWRPSIHMPRWVSRITLEVTGVRVERLQAITAEDVIAEGVDPGPHRCSCEPCSMTSSLCPASASSLVLGFGELWDSINAKRGYPWASNPFVWVVEFRRLHP